ncbi:MAG: peptidoglycan-binding protein [Clostridiales bacterium]|nr:peptidoglycan-binding protein [Clostridiales bacterium]
MKLKRTLTALLAVLMLLCSLPALADSVVSRPATDSYCPSERSGNHTHSWGNWDVTREATCKQAGSRIRYCRYCQYKQTRSIDKLAHKYGGWTVTKKATCSAAGLRHRKCTVCGSKQTQTIKKLEHSWSEWTIITPATEFSAGSRSRTCSQCGKTETEAFDPEGTLRRGDKGDAVKQLQENLNAAGYDCGTADGAFGKKTESAVKKLETAHSFAADGIAWPGVQKWLTGADSGSEGENGGDGGEGDEGGGKPNISLRNLTPGIGDGAPEAELVIVPELIPPGPYKEGDAVAAICTLYNLSGRILKLDTMTSDNPGFMVSSEAWMSADHSGLEPDTPYPFMAVFTVGADDVTDGFGLYHIQAEAHDPDYPDGTLEAHSEIAFTIQQDKPSLFVIFDWTYEYRGDTGETLSLPLAVYNNGNADLKLTGYSLIKNNITPETEGTDELTYPEEYDTQLFKAGDSFKAQLSVTLDEQDADYAAQPGNNDSTARGVRIFAETEDGETLDDLDYNFILMYYDTESVQPAIRLEVIPKTAQTDFAEGEKQEFTLYLFNESAEETLLLPMVAADDPKESLRAVYAESELLPADAVKMEDFYVFTAEDAGKPSVTLSWTGSAVDEGGEEYKTEPVKLEFTVYNNGYDWTPPAEDPISVVKSTTGSSKEPQGYQENEVIHYLITVTNTSGYTINEIEVYDPLKGSNEDAMVDMILTLPPSGSYTAAFDHTVTAEDVDNKKVINIATVRWADQRGNIYEKDSNKLEVPTYKPSDSRQQTKDGSYCVLTLTGVGDCASEYRLDFCTEHSSLDKKVRNLVSGAKTKKTLSRAWQKAEQLWTDALNKEYDRQLSGASEDLKKLVTEERELFFAQLALKREYLEAEHPDRPELISEEIVRELMSKTTQICYERHAAPKQRPDSLLSDGIAALDPATAQAACARTEKRLKNALKYSLTCCAEHGAVDAALNEALKEGDGEKMLQAFETARRAWLTSLDTVTNARYLASDAQTRDVIAAWRTAYGKWLEARSSLLEQLYPEQELTVKEVITQTIRTEVIETCINGK